MYAIWNCLSCMQFGSRSRFQTDWSWRNYNLHAELIGLSPILLSVLSRTASAKFFFDFFVVAMDHKYVEI